MNLMHKRKTGAIFILTLNINYDFNLSFLGALTGDWSPSAQNESANMSSVLSPEALMHSANSAPSSWRRSSACVLLLLLLPLIII